MKVLVTGGSGFVGSHVLDSLRANGHEVRNYDLVTSPHHANGEAVETVLGNLPDADPVSGAIH